MKRATAWWFLAEELLKIWPRPEMTVWDFVTGHHLSGRLYGAQRDLLPSLSGIFQNTQFIVTTHSALIVQAAPEDANIALLRREGDHVVIENDVKIPRNARVDQILTSDLFGLETARPPQIQSALSERDRLRAKADRTEAERQRLAELDAEIGDLPTAETASDQEAIDIVRRAAELLAADGSKTGAS